MLDDLDEFRRDPNLVFRYDLQTTTLATTLPARWRLTTPAVRRPLITMTYEYEEELVRSRRSAKGCYGGQEDLGGGRSL